MSNIENQLGKTRWGMIAKLIVSRLELIKLNFFKLNPLEKTGLSLVKNIFTEDSGSIFSILLFGGYTVLTSPGELLNIWNQSRIMNGHDGAYAEVGVFRGASAKLICEAKGQNELHLFDTFSGLPKVGQTD